MVSYQPARVEGPGGNRHGVHEHSEDVDSEMPPTRSIGGSLGQEEDADSDPVLTKPERLS